MMLTLTAVPRYGDVHSRLDHAHLHESPLSGLAGYSDIPSPAKLHPCFPARVLSELVPELSARCRPDCPPPAIPAPSALPSLGEQPLFLPEEHDDAIMTYDPLVQHIARTSGSSGMDTSDSVPFGATVAHSGLEGVAAEASTPSPDIVISSSSVRHSASRVCSMLQGYN